ncbi:MAG TPA: hypothetical protein ENG33_02390 [Chloroflexi bacterium]|nr:hypothetical protein [Chloroflexota bacterium]
MLSIYRTLATIAEREFKDVVKDASFMHFETEGDVRESFLSPEITRAFREVLSFIKAKLRGTAEL